MNYRTRRGFGLGPIMVLIAVAALLAACGDEESSDSDAAAGDDSDPGSEVEVNENVEDIPETTLQVQSVHGPDSAYSRAYDSWGDAVETASGGRLTFEIVYSSALAPVTEVEDALASGLFDIGTHAPVYNAARFPVDNVIQALNATMTPRPLSGTLQGVAAQTEFAHDDVYESPFEAIGVQPLIRPMAVVPAYHLGCAGSPVRSLDEADGKRVRVPGEHLAAEAEALGMIPTATTISEVYESLERGVVDCILAPASDIRDLGLIDVIDHWVIDSEVMFTGISGVQVSISQSTWDSLPTPAQQVLWDTAGEVFIPTVTRLVLEDTADSINGARDQGVEFHQFADDARATLEEFHADALESAADDLEGGDEFAAQFIEVHDKWLDDIETLGLDPGSADTFDDFDPSSVDFDKFTDAIIDIRATHGP